VPYRKAGADGFGVGGALYKPGMTLEDVGGKGGVVRRGVAEKRWINARGPSLPKYKCLPNTLIGS
jgi:hypothetical protein